MANTVDTLKILTTTWAWFRAEVERTGATVNSPEICAARTRIQHSESPSPEGFQQLDSVATDCIEVFCRSVPFLTSVLAEIEGLMEQRTALFRALTEYEDTGFELAYCPCCGAELDCSDDDDDDTCAEECMGHACHDGCALSAARKACAP